MAPISVIVPTCNRAANLPGLIEALLDQDYEGDVELIIVDNASTDETAVVLEECCRRERGVQWIREMQRGAAHARNAGARAARGDVLAFIDDDVIPARDWLRKMATVFEEYPEVDCAGGRVEAEWLTPPPEWLTPLNYPPLALQLSRGGSAEYLDASNASSCLIAANFAIRRRVFDEVGGFSTTYNRDEDRDLNLRLWSLGKRGKYVGAACVRALVQPERLTKRYHRRWYQVTGANHGRMRFREIVDRDGRLVPPLSGPLVLGAPRFLYRLLLDSATRWLRSALHRRRPEMFRAECDLRYYLSYIAARRREGA